MLRSLLSGTRSDNIDYLGNTLNHFEDTDEKECAKECIDESKCKGYALRKSDSRCHLKQEMTNRQHNRDIISGLLKGKDYALENNE